MNVVLISSDGQCGIYEYSHILLAGFQAAGHRARYIGVKNWDDSDLSRKLRLIQPDDDLIITEYEPGIFHLRAIVRAMAWLRLMRRKRVMLSVHEIEPPKFPGYHNIQWRLNQRARFGGVRELLRVIGATADVALHYLALRLFWMLMGGVPHAISVHSPKASDNITLIVPDRRKVVYIPHVVKSQTGDPAALRARLELPLDRFLLICPGFLFRRKRIIETIEQLPEKAELLVVGLPSEFDPGYLEEIKTYLAEHPGKPVRLIQDYERMEQYLLASDAVVMFYQDAYQSGIAALAIGAGKPCIWSDLPAFAEYTGAGLFVQTPQELRQAMIDIQEPAVYARLQSGAARLRDEFSPERIAAQYIAAIERLA